MQEIKADASVGIAGEVRLGKRLHLWPDPSLNSKVALAGYDDLLAIHEWILRCHHRISEWPTAEVVE